MRFRHSLIIYIDNMLRLLFIFLCINTACSSLHSLKKNPTAEELFQHASRLKEKSYYKEALTYFNKFKNRFLYSRLTKEADLAIADIYFAQEEWVKAGRAYESFFELHPQDPKSDHALFRLSLSYFNQLPDTEDRDLSLSNQALFHLNRHLKLFPNSPFNNQTRKHKQKILNLLARKQWMIARFHLRQGKPHSALPYAQSLMKDFSFLLPKKKEEEETLEKSKKTKKISTDLPSVKNLQKLIRELKQ